ncbi:MAG: hypothetical protein IJO52_07980, partial [Clostridia bacterium]|nr:hypothetical protein [Clostridia bacterium]
SATDAAKTDLVWIKNITQGDTSYRAVPMAGMRNEDSQDASLKRTPKTTYTSVRLNLARTADLDRYAEVAYVGFFASEDEAKNFDIASANEERFDIAQQKLEALSESGIEMKWGKVAREKSSLSDSKATVDENGNIDFNGVQTKTVVATNGFTDWVNEYIGTEGKIEITEYVPSTVTENGKYVFDITLENAYQTREVKNVTAYIAKKPNDYIMWRFNDSDILSKITIPTVNNIEIDKNLLKFETLYPIDGWGSHMIIDVSDIGTKPFDLENYTYMLMKYRRLGDTSPAYFNFVTEEGTEGTVHNVGFGEYPNDWYYTLFDPTVRDVITPWTYNYNLSRDRLEELPHCKFYDAPNALPFIGTAKSFTINFGMRNYAERGVELEFIAFFPSMEDARNYVENLEKLDDAISDTTVELKNYTSDTVSYYDGNTEAVAQAKAKAIIGDKISAPVDVAVNTVSYVAPGAADGSYVFNAVLTLDCKTVYTTQNITLTISKEIDNSPVVYKFTNPEFIKTIDGASDEYDFSGMMLDGNFFVLEIGADKPNVVSEVYNTLKLDANFTGGFTAIINGNEEIVYEGDADGVVYLDLGDFAGNIDTVKVQFNNEGAKVRALGFFADNTAAQAYNFNSVPAEITTVASGFSATCNYIHKDSKTLSDAKAYTLVYTNNKVKETGVKVADISYANYIPSTETKTGSVEITVTLAYGKETETCYKDVTYTAILAKDEEVVKATPKSIGHEFLGWDTITATKNFAAAAQTVEFSIKVAQAQLTGTMNVLENGTANIKLINGKITANGSLVANTSLKADTWTHVAITSDG